MIAGWGTCPRCMGAADASSCFCQVQCGLKGCGAPDRRPIFEQHLEDEVSQDEPATIAAEKPKLVPKPTDVRRATTRVLLDRVIALHSPCQCKHCDEVKATCKECYEWYPCTTVLVAKGKIEPRSTETP